MTSRQHWESVADSLLSTARVHARPGNSLFDLPGPVSRSGRWSDQFEGFARSFMLAAFRIAGDPEGTADLAQWYAEGIARGVDPAAPERWPRLDEIGQARCESCTIALGLHLTRARIWDAFDERTRVRVVDWLRPIVGATGLPPNNWLWFQLVVEAFLKSVDGPFDQPEIDRNLRTIESWYRGDGWYSDGAHPENFDYYSGWAMQFLPFVHHWIAGDDTLLQRHRARLRAYLEQAQNLVGAGGAPVVHGRSVTYRFAMLAPYWMGAMYDATPLRPGQTRSLASSVLNHFLRNSARSEQGLLTVGWHHEFDPVRQSYTGAGSPYWASKGFVGLMLPANHPVWTAEEEPTPAAAADRQVALPVPGWLVSSTAGDGVVRMINHGGSHLGETTGHDDPWYDRLAYSSHAAPDLGRGGCDAPVDSHVAVLLPDGRATRRADTERVSIDDRSAVSRSKAAPPTPNVPDVATDPALFSVVTASVVDGAAEVRMVRVDARDGVTTVTPGTKLRVGGYPLAAAEWPDVVEAATVRSGGLVSAVRGLDGMQDSGTSAAGHVNPFGDRSVTPWVRSSDDLVIGRVYAALVVLSGDPETAASALADLPQLTVAAEPAGHRVTVRWAGNGRADTVLLPDLDAGRRDRA